MRSYFVFFILLLGLSGCSENRPENVPVRDRPVDPGFEALRYSRDMVKGDVLDIRDLYSISIDDGTAKNENASQRKDRPQFLGRTLARDVAKDGYAKQDDLQPLIGK